MVLTGIASEERLEKVGDYKVKLGVVVMLKGLRKMRWESAIADQGGDGGFDGDVCVEQDDRATTGTIRRTLYRQFRILHQRAKE